MSYSSLKNQALFWDINMDSLNKEDNKKFIIARIIEAGSITDVKWMRENYNNNDIARVLQESKLISKRSAYFWKNILGIDANKILCLSQQYREIQKKHWISW